MSHRYKIYVSLFVLGLLVGACNHELAPPPVTGTGNGAGGSGAGGDGSGGQGGNTSCLGRDSCVPSCSQYFPGSFVSGYCDATGAFACPGESARLSSCAPNACAQFTPTCCDDTTGIDMPAPCGADGLKQACPARSHAHSGGGCIPASLGVTHCLELRDQPCTRQDQYCNEGATFCDCAPVAGDAGAMTWQCATLIL